MLPKRDRPSPEEFELARILSIPVTERMTDGEVELFSFEVLLASAYDAGKRLRPDQAMAMRAYLETGGGIFPISLGGGKSGTVIFIANAAFQAGIQKILVLLEPQNVQGFLRHHIPQWRRMINVTVPFHILAGRGMELRRRICRNGTPGCYVMPYSLLSQPDAAPQKQADGTMLESLLELIQPELIIADEVHNLKNAHAARTNRIRDFLKSYGPRIVGLSGTILQKSLKDVHHLMEPALLDGSPLPRNYNLMLDWDDVVNAEAPVVSKPVGALQPLLSWAREQTGEAFDPEFTESYRRALRHRVVTAPGIVVSLGESVGASLQINDLGVELDDKFPGAEDLKTLIKAVNEDDVAPNGDVIAHAFHRYAHLYQLTAGFYSAMSWPKVEAVAKSHSCETGKAAEALENWRMQHQFHQDYNSELRRFFRAGAPPGLDTPREVGRALQMKDKRLAPELHDRWHKARELSAYCQQQFGFVVERQAQPVRICDYKIRGAVEWAKKNERGIIWVWNKEIGIWVMEALTAAGVPAIHCPAGQQHDVMIESIGNPDLGGKGDKLIVASIRAHRTGKNLQAFDRALFVQWPRDATDAEQAIGREHRFGQKADVVLISTMMVLEFDDLVRAACINDCIFSMQTLGSPSKIVTADYDPLPRIYTSEFLRERGIEDVKILNAEGIKIREEAFGS